MAPVAPQPEDPHQIELIKQYAPSGIRTLRACIRCRLIMSKEQFLQHGCPSCKDVLHMQDDEGRVLACTSSNFQGFITSIRPGAFVSRFNGLEKRLPGCYALTVQGTIPDYILHESEYEMDSEPENAPGSRLGSRAGSRAGSRTGSRAGSRAPSVAAAPRSPSLHLTEDEDEGPLVQAQPGKKGKKEEEQGEKPKETEASPASPPSSPSSPDKGLFSPEGGGGVDEILKGLFSPEEDEKDSPTKRRRLGQALMRVGLQFPTCCLDLARGWTYTTLSRTRLFRCGRCACSSPCRQARWACAWCGPRTSQLSMSGPSSRPTVCPTTSTLLGAAKTPSSAC